MKTELFIAGALTFGVTFAAVVDSAADPAIDPLDAPAQMSRLAQSTQLTDVIRVGERLVAAGSRGHILVSDAHGASWVQAKVPVDLDLTRLSFPTPEIGWAVGHSGVVLRSKDGGRTWSKVLSGTTSAAAMTKYYKERLAAGDEAVKQALADIAANAKEGPTMPWLDVLFTDESRGYLVGPFNTIIETADGGKTWIPLMDRVENPDAMHLNSIAQTSDGTLYIASERGKMFVRTPGSQRFVMRDTGYRGSFFGVLAVDNAVIAYGMGGSVFRSLDGGQSWSLVETGTKRSITNASVVTGDEIALVTQEGELLVGHAGAGNFSAVPVSRRFLYAGVAQAAAGKVAIVGAGGVQLENVPTKRK